MTERPSLRDRRRQETRVDISWAAVRLTVERGLSNVTIEDIAREAGVSPRTVNNYFSSKAEAIVARHQDRARGIADHLRARPASEPLWTALREASLTQLDADRDTAPGARTDPQWTAGVRVMIAEPALAGEFLKANVAAEEALAEAIAERLGADVHDLRVQLIATTVGGVLRTVIQEWLRTAPHAELASIVHRAFDTLAEVFP
ncbi:TetR/AcrR family transcriptional regulator [Amycolatopsis orientalis]|uniref:TetR/AcrR family transcriptional regulator n=1 Tax=Amycolatopsis orientalis TaxID=31958 RepID=UPI0005616430|nr:TetR family transcriptional regulator [Amycolatopsis orientalis]